MLHIIANGNPENNFYNEFINNYLYVIIILLCKLNLDFF